MASKFRGTDGDQTPVSGSASIATLNNVETELLGASAGQSSVAAATKLDGFDVELMDRFEVGVKNTGAQSIVVSIYYQYVVNGQWFKDAANTATVAGGASGRIPLINVTARRIRVTGLSAAGASAAQVEGRGMGYQ